MRTLSYIIALVVSGLMGCSHPAPFPPPGIAYFAFVDKSKTAALEPGALRIERVDLADTTKVLAFKQMGYPDNLVVYTNRDFGRMFQPKNDGILFDFKGINKLRLTYSGRPDVDWLEFKNMADEWLNPQQVKFNGKLIPRLETDQPTATSYLYVLK